MLGLVLLGFLAILVLLVVVVLGAHQLTAHSSQLTAPHCHCVNHNNGCSNPYFLYQGQWLLLVINHHSQWIWQVLTYHHSLPSSHIRSQSKWSLSLLHPHSNTLAALILSGNGECSVASLNFPQWYSWWLLLPTTTTTGILYEPTTTAILARSTWE